MLRTFQIPPTCNDLIESALHPVTVLTSPRARVPRSESSFITYQRHPKRILTPLSHRARWRCDFNDVFQGPKVSATDKLQGRCRLIPMTASFSCRSFDITLCINTCAIGNQFYKMCRYSPIRIYFTQLTPFYLFISSLATNLKIFFNYLSIFHCTVASFKNSIKKIRNYFRLYTIYIRQMQRIISAILF